MGELILYTKLHPDASDQIQPNKQSQQNNPQNH